MHGSGYGQFKKHLTEKFEKKIYLMNLFFGFLFNKSKFIGRYTLNTKIKKSEHNIFWIGKNNFNEFDKMDIPDQYKHQKYEDHLDYIDRELNKIENIFFVKGKNNNKKLWLPRNITILNKNIKIEFIIMIVFKKRILINYYILTTKTKKLTTINLNI